MADIRSYRDLVAWQKAFALGKAIYAVSHQFPREELYGLTSQVRRSVVSIASNIAEGYGRGSTKDYLRFLNVARGSIYELDTQVLFAREFGYAEPHRFDQIDASLDECSRVLGGLIRAVEASQDQN